ncbi:MAG: tripartite tricarboxylate transporter substrate binding protein [Acetobacteraceae bacterium]|nr:tripartite tricarboxylate transporter substrate binding protein [Acetobacteraceae bacterium]MDW8398816.1 tripartite tricarboxylate transporter substrate binding protein [Acetobacteraceae bacterium]
MPSVGRRAALALGLLSAAGPAGAQTVGRNVRVLVGFAAGGPTDLVARLYTERLRPGYAAAAIVDNRPGASGRLAVEAVRGAEPDGATLLVTPASVMTLQPVVFPREARYDATTDLTPVCTVCDFGFGIAVPMSHPARSFAELVSWVRAQPQEVAYGSPGSGSGPHFLGEMLGQAIGKRLNHIPYRGSVLAVQDTLAGRVPISIAVLSDQVPHHGTGLRILAVTSDTRVPRLPDVPTVAEAGMPQLAISEWMGLFAPPRTPPAIVEALHRIVAAAAQTNEVRETLARFEFQPTVTGSDAFPARIRRERDTWARVVRDSGFQPET